MSQLVFVNTSSWERRREVAAEAAAAGVYIEGGDFGSDMPNVFVRVGEQLVCAWPKFGTWAIGLWFQSDGGRGTRNWPHGEPTEKIVEWLRGDAGAEDPYCSRIDLTAAVAALQAAIPWVCKMFGIPMPHDPRMERPL